MALSLKQFAADHGYLLDLVRRATGFAAPLAVTLDDLADPLLKKARRGELLPVDGVLVRDWDPNCRRTGYGIRAGMRRYEIDGVHFVLVHFAYDPCLDGDCLSFWAVDAKDYRSLYRAALRCYRELEKPLCAPPVMDASQREALWQNTIGFLSSANVTRLKAYGVRARRGILLMGAPGNGKTMACRWIMDECRKRGWEWKEVGPDAYRTARADQTIPDLFSVDKRGVIFFDDMDLALRDREKVHETEDQAVFLSALDGIKVNEGAVFVFTSNCAPELIDRAFKRPGRLDVVLHFNAPRAELRRQLIDRWHTDIRSHLDIEDAIAVTDGFSFAEIEELKSLLVMHYLESGVWDWSWARRQFEENRRDLDAKKGKRLGFLQELPHTNGVVEKA